MNKRLKILLCGFVNHANAQNINCSALARYLDKGKFDVHAFCFAGMPLDREAFAGVTLHPVSLRRGWARLNPARVFFRMIAGRFDVIYMPKIMGTDVLYARLFGRRRCLVSSLEGVVTESVNCDPARLDFFSRMSAVFAISRCIQESAARLGGREYPVLYLGHECPVAPAPREALRTVAYVGNIKENKRPLLFLECAKAFPDLRFIMVGDGDLMEAVSAYVSQNSLSNVTLTGRVPNAEVYRLLRDADLLLMTSRNEGLPKVILEAASCAVPAVYINENYAVDYIVDGETGFAVPDVGGMIGRIQLLRENPALFRYLSQNVLEMSKRFVWPALVGGYETFFADAFTKKEVSSC